MDEWIEEAKRHLRRLGIHEDSVHGADVICDHLMSDARREIMSSPQELRCTATGVFELLVGAFGDLRLDVASQSDLFNRKQKAGESIQGFSTALKQLFAIAVRRNPSMAGSRDSFLSGLLVNNLADGNAQMCGRRLLRERPGLPFESFRRELLYVLGDTHQQSQSRSGFTFGQRNQFGQIRQEPTSSYSATSRPPVPVQVRRSNFQPQPSLRPRGHVQFARQPVSAEQIPHYLNAENPDVDEENQECFEEDVEHTMDSKADPEQGNGCPSMV